MQNPSCPSSHPTSPSHEQQHPPQPNPLSQQLLLQLQPHDQLQHHSSPAILPPAPSLVRSPSTQTLPRTHRDQLDRVERDLLQEIQALQTKLAQTRRHLSNHHQVFQSNRLYEGSSKPARKSTSSRIPGPSNDHQIRTRVVSVSLRLPRNDHRTTPRQQLFDAALPPKPMLALQDAVRIPFVWVGSDPPDAVSDPDHSHHLRTRSPLPTPLSSPSQSQSSSSANFAHTSRHSRYRSHFPPHRSVRVSLPDDPVLMKRYLTFCDDILWRLMHHDYHAVDIPDLVRYWQAYQTVNARFAQAVSEVCEDGDIIWIHNFHLMLLPAMLRETVWYAKIGFFLYTPFPSAELFRVLSYREQILRGIIGADIIGFHSYDHVKQFVTSCRRQLGLDATPGEIVADAQSGRVCKVRVYPGGIDVDAVRGHISSKLVKSRVAELRARFEGCKLMIGVDRLDDCFAGLLQKILAFERLLSDNPHLVGNIVLIQAAMLPKQSRTGNSYREQSVLLNEYVTRVNSTFGTWSYSPVHFINSLLDPADVHALMCVGHVCVVTTVRDGMGLVPHEWTVCQHGGYNGAIVLSEFASAAHSFATALHVNPWDVDAIATKMKVALELTDTSRQIRNEAAYRFVTSHTAIQWGTNFLDDLDGVDNFASCGPAGPPERPPLDTTVMMRVYLGTLLVPSPTSSATGLSSMSSVAAQTAPQLIYGEQHFATVARNGFRGAFGADTAFRPGSSSANLPNDENVPAKSSSFGSAGGDEPSNSSSDIIQPKSAMPKPIRVCLFILDVDGTLVPSHTHCGKLAIAQRVVDVIQGLVDASPHNHVLLMSSSGRQCLHEVFGHLRVYLAAEDGAFLKSPNAKSWSVLFHDSALHDSNLASRNSPGNTIVNGNAYKSPPKLASRNGQEPFSAEQMLSPATSTIHSSIGVGEKELDGRAERCKEMTNSVPDDSLGKIENDRNFDHVIEKLEVGPNDAVVDKNTCNQDFGNESNPSIAAPDASVTNKPSADVGVYLGSEEIGCQGEDAASTLTGRASMSSHASFSSIELAQGECGQLVSWKENVLPVMQHFADRTPGVVIEQGEAIMTWHYDEAEGDFGGWQSRHLYKHLESLAMRKLAINLICEDAERRWIRVRPKMVDKPKALALMIKRLLEGGGTENGEKIQVDFVLCVGNDRSDEGLFDILGDKVKADRIGIGCSSERIFTCRVGRARGGARTSARTFLDSPARVVQMLEAMCGTPTWALL